MRPARTLAAAAAVATLACAHVARDRKTAEIHHDLGVEALRSGRHPDALKEFDAALAKDDTFAEAWYGRALVLDLGFGHADEAEKDYRRAIALRPAYSEAHNALGQLLARTGRYPEALAEFDLALENMLYKEPYLARCNKALVLYRTGRREEAMTELRSTLQVAPTFCKGRRELGRLLLEEGRAKDAVEQLSQYARWCERVPDAHLQLGLAKMRAGDVAGAKESFERCRDLGGGTADADECRRSLALLE
jgi:type IV pilus biogenesis/stability protein PilW